MDDQYSLCLKEIPKYWSIAIFVEGEIYQYYQDQKKKYTILQSRS